MKFSEPIILGRTGLKAGRMGVSSSYGTPTAALEEAFERGCNYFAWGTFIIWHLAKMRNAIRHIVQQGKRDKLILAIVSFAHQPLLTELFFMKALKNTGTDFADVLLLGGFSKHPSPKIIEGALKMKEKGMCRYLGLTGHNPKLFAQLRKENIFDVFHVLYNAAYREAEIETFPFLQGDKRPGVVTFTATSWGQLLKANKMPIGELPPTSVDCYRFVLSHPVVDICLTAPKTIEHMRQNLAVLDLEPMQQEELERMRRIGVHINKISARELDWRMAR
jgi:predicted aldo/keto reductase-like oxidoreductase